MGKPTIKQLDPTKMRNGMRVRDKDATKCQDLCYTPARFTRNNTKDAHNTHCNNLASLEIDGKPYCTRHAQVYALACLLAPL